MSLTVEQLLANGGPAELLGKDWDEIEEAAIGAGLSKRDWADVQIFNSLFGGGAGAAAWGAITGTLGDQADLQAALDAKAATTHNHDASYAAIAHATATNNPHAVTKSQVGLANADNTSDAAKPVSTAQQTALDAKADNSSLGAVATSNDYGDLDNKPTLGTAADNNEGDFATAAQAVPAGGTTGQVLKKASNDDNDVGWDDDQTGTGFADSGYDAGIAAVGAGTDMDLDAEDGAVTGGDGGTLTLSAGDGGVVSGDGGDVVLSPGGTTTGSAGAAYVGANRILTQADEGSGNGIDADTLDGNEATAFATSAQGAKADTAVQPGDALSSLDTSVTGAELDGIKTKADNITVSQPVDLDSMETLLNALDQAIVLIGTWDASAGTFPGGGTAQTGHLYIVSVAGTVDGVAFDIDDRIVALTDNASTTTYAANWFKRDYNDAVLSVAGLTGAISAAGLRTALNVEDGAAADQDAADIRGLGFFDTSNDGTGSGLDADLLDGNEASAFATAGHDHDGDYLPVDLGIVTKSDADTFALTDAGKMVKCTKATANDQTVPLNSSVAFPIGTQILVSQAGAGQVTIVATGGVTINKPTSKGLKIAEQFGKATLIKIGTDEWDLEGNITA